MKPAIRSIFDPAEQQHFKELNELTAQIKDNKLLTEKAKQDAYKVIENLKYIKINLDYIEYCINHPEDASIYRFNDDKGKGVLRDHNGTSFHFTTFNNAREARDEFLAAINNIERIALALKTTKPLVFYVVVNAFEWDKDSGCLGKRVEPFVSAAKAIDEGLDAFQLSNVFVNIYVKGLSHRQGTVEQAVNDFVKAYHLTDDDKNKIKKGLDNTFSINDFNESLFDTFGALSTNLTVNNDNLLDFVTTHTKDIAWGFTGEFIQLQFDLTKKDHADALVDFLRTQNIYDIKKAKVELNHTSTHYVVRLTEYQADSLNLPIPSRATNSTVIHGSYARQTHRDNNTNNNNNNNNNVNNNTGCTIS